MNRITTLLLILCMLISNVAAENKPTPHSKAICADIVPDTVQNGLEEVFARAKNANNAYGNIKPIEQMSRPLFGDGTVWDNTTGVRMQSELLHFTDTEYGTHCWKLSNDAQSTQVHNSLGYSPWSSDGSVMGLFSGRAIHATNGALAARTNRALVVDSNGDNIRKLPWDTNTAGGANQATKWTINQDGATAYIWDSRSDYANRAYWGGAAGLWVQDIAKYETITGGGTSTANLIAHLPNPGRRKEVMDIDYNGKDGGPFVLMVDRIYDPILHAANDTSTDNPRYKGRRCIYLIDLGTPDPESIHKVTVFTTEVGGENKNYYKEGDARNTWPPAGNWNYANEQAGVPSPNWQQALMPDVGLTYPQAHNSLARRGNGLSSGSWTASERRWPYPISKYHNHTGKGPEPWTNEQLFHSIGFTKMGDGTIRFGYGPWDIEGELVSFMAMGGNYKRWDGKTGIVVFYDGERTRDDSPGMETGKTYFGVGAPYFSHGSFSAKGPDGSQYFAYYGSGFTGKVNTLPVTHRWNENDEPPVEQGLHIIALNGVFDPSKQNYSARETRVFPLGGGHTAWNSNDANVIVGGIRGVRGQGGNDETQYLHRGYLDRSVDNGETFVNTHTSTTTQSGGNYLVISRPDLSPDGTKVHYHSSMLRGQGVHSQVDSYVAVVHYPFPPAHVGGSGTSLTWERHTFNNGHKAAETKRYIVYISRDNRVTWSRFAHVDGIHQTRLDLAGKGLGDGVYYFGVITEEHSGLQSNELSTIVKATIKGAAIRFDANEQQDAEPVKGFKTSLPAPVGVPKITDQRFESDGENHFGYNIVDWSALATTTLSDPDIWYYNIYYSVESVPEATPSRRIASVPAGTTQYVDWQARRDVRSDSHFYFVTAVDKQGRESGK